MGPCWAVEMNSFLESICDSKIHLTQNRAWGIVAKQEASAAAWSLYTTLNRNHAPQSMVVHFFSPEVKADFTSPPFYFFHGYLRLGTSSHLFYWACLCYLEIQLRSGENSPWAGCQSEVPKALLSWPLPSCLSKTADLPTECLLDGCTW